MKPFDEEKAKAGVPVCTRDGRDVRIICYDRKGRVCPILALVAEEDGTERLLSYYNDGGFYEDDAISTNDLFMKPIKRAGWVNLYNFAACGLYSTEKEAGDKGVPESGIFSTEKEARDIGMRAPNYVATASIEWEE